MRDQSGDDHDSDDSSSAQRRDNLPSIQERGSSAFNSTTSADSDSVEDLLKKSDEEVLSQLRVFNVRQSVLAQVKKYQEEACPFPFKAVRVADERVRDEMSEKNKKMWNLLIADMEYIL